MDFVKIGDLIANRYRVSRIIGAGSFAWVFAAHDLHSERTVALKMLRPERFADDDALRRFESRELRLLERIEESQHSPHVVRLLEKRLLRHEGLPFIVLEYIDGPSLQEWLAQQGTPEPKEAVRIGIALARGLAAIHAAGGVHRDLKPSNVRMRNGKSPVLVDLGIARALWETQKLTQGFAPLTPRYAAPEQREGLPATPATDVYALGVCLHEMLAGQSDLSRRTGKLIAACMARNPLERPTVRDVLESLEGLGASPSSRRSIWPIVFLAGCSVFPGETIYSPEAIEMAACTPLSGLVRAKINHEATSTDSTIQWQPFELGGRVGHRVSATLPKIDPTPMVIVDDGGEGRYEVIGWFGETCRHFAVQACAERAVVRELENCVLPRPISFTKSARIWGDIDGDGVDDVMTYGSVPGGAGKSPSIVGNVLRRRANGPAQLIERAFDLSPIDTYHLDPAVRTGDIDRDGCADLVIAAYPTGGLCSSTIHVLWGDCQGKFTLSDDVAHVPLPANQPDLGDVDEDGFLDLVTGPDDDGDPGQTFLLRGTGHGFGLAEEIVDVYPDVESGRDKPGYGSALLADVNGDGHLDLFLKALSTAPGTGNNESVQVIHLGRGDGTFDENPAVFVNDAAVAGGLTMLPIRGR